MPEQTPLEIFVEELAEEEVGAVDAVAIIEEVAKEEYSATLKREVVQRLIAKRALSAESLRSVVLQHTQSRRMGRRALGIPYSDNDEVRADAIRAHFIRHQ